MALVTVTEAANLAGVSRGTIYNKIETGDLSRTPDGIDTNELIRVFGKISLRQERPHQHSNTVTNDDNDQRDDIAQALLARLDAADDEKKWLREQLEHRQRIIDERDATLTALLPAPGQPTALEDANLQIGRYLQEIEQLKKRVNASFWRRLFNAT